MPFDDMLNNILGNNEDDEHRKELIINKVAKALLGTSDSDNVSTKLFANVEIVNCNATTYASFCKSSIVFKSEHATPFIFFWKDSFSRIIRGKVLKKEKWELSAPEEEAVQILLDFLSDGKKQVLPVFFFFSLYKLPLIRNTPLCRGSKILYWPFYLHTMYSIGIKSKIFSIERTIEINMH